MTSMDMKDTICLSADPERTGLITVIRYGQDGQADVSISMNLSPPVSGIVRITDGSDRRVSVRIDHAGGMHSLTAGGVAVLGPRSSWKELGVSVLLGFGSSEPCIDYPDAWYGSRATYRMVRDRIADADENGEDPEYEYEKEHADDGKIAEWQYEQSCEAHEAQRRGEYR